ncbi:MAG: hypothetical protein IJO77_01520, partial [Oscillospiraceae bacterium]|nr:hypothetical protein [Oscillospiraceae bacterium]
RGMHITGIRGERFVPLKAVCGTEKLTDQYDFCIVSTKSYDTMDAVRSVLPFLKEDGAVLVLQNGMCLDSLLELVGADRAACGVTSYSSTMVDSTHMEITGEGGFVIGMAAGGCEKLRPLKEAMDKMAPTELHDNIIEPMYAKLIINSGITCGGALTGQLLGQMLKGARARKFFISIVYEDMEVAGKMGIKVPPFGGKLDYYKFIAGETAFDDLRRHIMLFVVGLKYKRLKSSSLTSLERGKNTEVDALNGYISAKAKILGVKTPVNDKLIELIKEIERGERKSSPDNLKEIIG